MEYHYAYLNAGILCSYCSYIMDCSKSDHTVEPFEMIAICPNITCPHCGIKYRVPRQSGIKLERIEEKSNA
jgi:hypothetical protein